MNPPIAVAKEHRWFGALLAGERLDLEGEALARFARWLERHRMAPYAHHRAQRTNDAALEAALFPARRACIVRTLTMEAWIRDVLRVLVAGGVAPIVFKGLGVAHLLYSASDLRPLGDLDLLVPSGRILRSLPAMRSLGFDSHKDPMALRYRLEDHYTLPYFHDRHGLVELHHALYRDCSDEFFATIVERRRRSRVLDADIFSLRDDDLFLVLATHWGLSRPGSQWLWLLDLVLLGGRLSSSDWQRLASTATRFGLQVFAHAALRFLDALWDVRFRDAPDLTGSLSWLERHRSDALFPLCADVPCEGQPLSVARRLSGRPVRGSSGRLRWLWAHPGGICLELGVDYSPFTIPWYRARHVGRRVVETGRWLSRSFVQPRRK